MDERPDVGLAGVKQVTGDGVLFPTIRRFPNALRALGEALGSERGRCTRPGPANVSSTWALRPELDIDWTSGSFMLVRREALLSVGILDERSFIYGEEPDLCLRLRRGAGGFATSADDDRPSRRQGRGESSDGGAECICAAASLARSLRTQPPSRVPGRRLAAVCASCGRSRQGRGRQAPARGLALGFEGLVGRRNLSFRRPAAPGCPSGGDGFGDAARSSSGLKAPAAARPLFSRTTSRPSGGPACSGRQVGRAATGDLHVRPAHLQTAASDPTGERR